MKALEYVVVTSKLALPAAMKEKATPFEFFKVVNDFHELFQRAVESKGGSVFQREYDRCHSAWPISDMEESPENAFLSILSILEEAGKYNNENSQEIGYSVEVVCGVDTGHCFSGFIGDERFVIGDAVDHADLFSDLNTNYKTRALASARVVSLLGEGLAEKFKIEKVDSIVLKGAPGESELFGIK